MEGEMTITVKRTGRTWGVFRGSELIEGGFFSREAALRAADEYRRSA